MRNATFTMQNFLQDPQSRLNTAGFGNVEKAVQSEDFALTYPKDKFIVLTKTGLTGFIAKSVIAINDAETESDSKEIAKAVASELDSIKRVLVYDGDETVERFVKAKENDLEKGGGDDIEKGAIANALDYGLNVKFNKTGKQIKERLEILKGVVEARAAAARVTMATKLALLTIVPTRDLDRWDYSGLGDVIAEKPKVFEWEQCNYKSESVGASNPNGVVYAPNQEQATVCREYNNAVSQLVEYLVDTVKIEAYIRNLDDKKSYEVQAREAIALGL